MISQLQKECLQNLFTKNPFEEAARRAAPTEKQNTQV